MRSPSARGTVLPPAQLNFTPRPLAERPIKKIVFMPVRLRLTLLFSLLVFILLGLICTGVYIAATKTRQYTVGQRLESRAKNVGALLSREAGFSIDQIRKMDSVTKMVLRRKIALAYDHQYQLRYSYLEDPNDSFVVSRKVLEDARAKREAIFFEQNNKEAVAYQYTDDNIRLVIVAAGEDEDGHRTLARLRQILILTFLIGNLTVLAVGYFFSGRLLRPVRKITREVEEISAHNLVRRLPTGTVKDEWHHLAGTLNDLLNRLQESFDMQRRFIANASHELSTPLTSISSQLEVALQRDRTAADYRAVIQSIYQDVRQMGRLTHTLLEFAKASGNAGGLELVNMRIDEIILDLPAHLAKMNPAYTATIQFDDLPEEDEKLVVYGNRLLLETAIRNIAANACKYSPNHQANIRLKAGAAVYVSIADQGKGIPPEKVKTIFQPFYRIEKEGERSADGFGLGLSLSYRIIRLHKGTIHVQSILDQGSTFTIELPVAGHA